nr:MAG TPA: hypothetical protein [Caudoviricetes sp.]
MMTETRKYINLDRVKVQIRKIKKSNKKER